MVGRPSRRSKDPFGEPVHGPDVVRALVAEGRFRIETNRESKTITELAEELKRVTGIEVPRAEILREIRRVLATLTLLDFAGIYRDPAFGDSDEYGTYVADVGVYIKVRVTTDPSEVLVISFHPIHEEPLATRGGDIVRRRP